MIILGNSQIREGVSPEEIERYLPECKVVNWGFSKSGLNPVMFDAAEKKLTKQNLCPIIVMGVSASTLTRSSLGNRQYLQELNRPWDERVKRLYLTPLISFFQPVFLFSISGDMQNAYSTVKYYDSGFIYTIVNNFDEYRAMKQYGKQIKKRSEKTICSEKIIDSLIQRTKIWTEKGYTVIAYRPPMPRKWWKLEDKYMGYNEKAIRSRFEKAGGFWINVNPDEWKTHDGTHLCGKEAVRFSRRLALHIVRIIDTKCEKAAIAKVRYKNF